MSACSGYRFVCAQEHLGEQALSRLVDDCCLFSNRYGVQVVTQFDFGKPIFGRLNLTAPMARDPGAINGNPGQREQGGRAPGSRRTRHGRRCPLRTVGELLHPAAGNPAPFYGAKPIARCRLGRGVELAGALNSLAPRQGELSPYLSDTGCRSCKPSRRAPPGERWWAALSTARAGLRLVQSRLLATAFPPRSTAGSLRLGPECMDGRVDLAEECGRVPLGSDRARSRPVEETGNEVKGSCR